MKNDCIFCAIADGEIPCFKVYEDDAVLAYLDINPFAEGHTLVIPKAHFTGLLDAPDEVLAGLLARVKRIAAHLKATLPCDGFNILQNNGAAAGQTVPHIHFHIVPRRGNAEGGIAFASTKGDMDAMPKLAFEKEAYADILAKDRRYDTRAYDFVLDVIHAATEDAKGHVSGQELLAWFRDMALDSWGPMAYTVLSDWGVTCCEDVGEIVFNLYDAKRIGKTSDDSRADFIGGFNFKEEFLEPYGG